MINDKIEEFKKGCGKEFKVEGSKTIWICRFFNLCSECKSKIEGYNLAQKEINDLKREIKRLTVYGESPIVTYEKEQTSKKVEELKNISIPYPLDTTEEFDEGFKFAMKKVREEVNKIFTPESIDNYNKKEAKYNFNEKDILQNHIPQREGSHDLRNSSSLTSSPEEDLCKYGHKKQSPQVFIERVARLDKEGINAICGTDEKYSKYIKKFTKKEVKE